MTSIEKLLGDISSLHWWISVVLVGLAINLLSAYVKPQLDRWAKQISSSRQQKQADEDQLFREHVALLAGNTQLLICATSTEARCRWQAVSMAIASLLFASAAVLAEMALSAAPVAIWVRTLTVVLVFFSVAGVALSFWLHLEARRFGDLLQAAAVEIETAVVAKAQDQTTIEGACTNEA
jgi:hypothetical protein